MINYFETMFDIFLDYLGYIGSNISLFPILIWIFGLVTIASAVDYIKRIFVL